MRRLRFITALATGLAASTPVLAETLPIGVAAPLSGASAILGKQMRDGALAAAGQAAVSVVDDACTANGGIAAAQAFAAAKVRIVVGFLCTEALEAALPILKGAGIPVITPGVRTDSITDRREKTGWPIYRLAPRADGERAAVGDILTKLWRDELFAIVDDGTIYGRELAESFRLSVEQAGLKPVFVDTFRPQLDNQIGLVGRLRKAEASRVFAGGDHDDIAIIERDAEKLGVPLIVAGGETLRGAPTDTPLATGTLMIGLPEWASVADPAKVQALRDAGTIPEGYVLPAYAAMEVAMAALTQAQADGGGIEQALGSSRFATAIGPVKFDAKGDLTENPYRLFRFDGMRFVAATNEE